MIDCAYSQITDFLDPADYQSMREFHVRTNNTFVKGEARATPTLLPKQKLIEEMEYADLPLSPFDGGRVSLVSAEPPNPRRRSAERFSSDPLPFQTLSTLLFQSFGESLDAAGHTLRPYPSGGALYSVQVIVGLRAERIAGEPSLQSGFYHYRPSMHALDLIAEVKEATLKALLMNKDKRPLGDSAITLFYVGVLGKAMFKYGTRGYRLALLEAGAMMGQAERIAHNLNCESRIWSYFDDLYALKLMNLNPATCFPCILKTSYFL